MYVVTVEFVIAAGNHDRFQARVLRQARDSLTEPGCRVFDVCVDRNRPGHVFLYEVYDTADDFDAHLKSAHFKAFDAESRDWVVEKHVRTMERLEAGSPH